MLTEDVDALPVCTMQVRRHYSHCVYFDKRTNCRTTLYLSHHLAEAHQVFS